MTYTNEEIVNAINGNRAIGVQQCEYRKMLALESIAASLAKLVAPPVAIAPAELPDEALTPGPIQYVTQSPEPLIRRTRRHQGPA